MGLIQAGLTAAGTLLADQWKEYFYCDSLQADILVAKGQKRIGKGSSNTNGSDNIISNGSIIAVNEGQCMIIVDQGKIAEICAEPGEFIWNNSTEPSIFTGSLGESVKESFKALGRRFTFGGTPPKDQRVYYINIKELMENRFGTPNPILFRVVDSKINLDIDVTLRCSGVYSYKITDPVIFYTNVCGNVTSVFERSEIDVQLKSEFISALNPAVGILSANHIRPNELPAHAHDLEDAMNKELSAKWKEKRGLQVVTVALTTVDIPAEDLELIKTAQRNAINKDPSMAAATLVAAQADAMKEAAKNGSGAMTGFMGMGFAQQQGAVSNIQGLFEAGQKQQQQAAEQAAQQQAAMQQAEAEQKALLAKEWKCTCGATANGNFCPECGAKKPQDGWTCACGAVNKGKFCTQCGAKKPEGAPLYKCDKCGWEPEDPQNPPKFCPECGDVFDDKDVK